VPQFYRPEFSGRLGTRASRKRGRTLPATLARLLMQAHGSSQVSPQSAKTSAEAVVCFAGVAQLVEHLFCKQVVRGSSPRASSAGGRPLAAVKPSESCPSGQREQAVNLPAYAYAGSNPALSTATLEAIPSGRGSGRVSLAGVAQLVERQPSKLNVEGSNPFSRSVIAGRPGSHDSVATIKAHLAQMVEHVLGKDEVTSSILVVGSKQ
jgi:hypothetical protein